MPACAHAVGDGDNLGTYPQGGHSPDGDSPGR